MTANSYVFFGSEPQFVLIVAGIHESEQGGIEVAHWIRTKLAARKKPTRFGAVVIPDVFPERGLLARADEWKRGDTDNTWREIPRPGGADFHPARHFPPPGEPLSVLKKGLLIGRDGTELREAKRTLPQLPEIRYVIQFVEQFRPIRIVSVHGTHPVTRDQLPGRKAQTGMSDDDIKNWDGVSAIKGVNFPGIFVDPRYQLGKDCPKFDLEICKFDPLLDPAFPVQSAGKDGKGTDRRFDSARTQEGRADDALALKAAQAIAKLDPTLVRGNHVAEAVPVVHYAKASTTPEAFSLGDWGPVEVPSSKGLGARPGAPVFTVEVDDIQESWAFLDGVQMMSEKGEALLQTPSPELRVAKNPGRKILPAKFNKTRSEQLQAYAQGIIDTILEVP
ncbi:hypothetical protein OH768_31080 [Streptomyces sp. NBC_01622]|uniref:hypothetical protein n=1 Tax=Streptomyces sp. NBC_01622 TaxID=2975903 RepID=UPI003864BAF4|nr:hypothetical protein OH768_31080 [Streptomyces sp. NBC_01622]